MNKRYVVQKGGYFLEECDDGRHYGIGITRDLMDATLYRSKQKALEAIHIHSKGDAEKYDVMSVTFILSEEEL